MSPKTKLTSNPVHINAVLLIQRERTIGDLCHRKPRLTLSRNISYSPRVGSIVYPGNPEFPIATWRCTPLPMTSALSLGASISANQCSSIACIPLSMCVPTVYAAVHACISLRNTAGSLIGIVTRPSVQTWKISECDRFLSPYFPSSLLSRTSVCRVIYMVREKIETHFGPYGTGTRVVVSKPVQFITANSASCTLRSVDPSSIYPVKIRLKANRLFYNLNFREVARLREEISVKVRAVCECFERIPVKTWEERERQGVLVLSSTSASHWNIGWITWSDSSRLFYINIPLINMYTL